MIDYPGGFMSEQKSILNLAKARNVRQEFQMQFAIKCKNEIFGHEEYVRNSLSYIHSKLYGNELTPKEMHTIIEDVVAGQLSDIHIAMFLSGTVDTRLNNQEVLSLTQSMVQTGEKITWPEGQIIADKHCVGGLPGNRTSLIIVPIIAAYGLIIPKTSSRAITSPAGSADTMEIFAPVNLDIKSMKKVIFLIYP